MKNKRTASEVAKAICEHGFVSIPTALKWPDPRFILEHLLPEAGLAMIHGPSGVGKSFVVIDLMMHIARGLKWNGYKTAPGLVVYVSAEGRGGLKNRLRAWLLVHRKRASGIPVAILDEAVNLSKRLEVIRFIEKVKLLSEETGLPVQMLAADTLARCAVGAEENSSKEMGEIIENCQLIQTELGCTVLLVHHTGKDEAKGARGTSALKAAMDTEISLSANGCNRMTLKVSKQKDSEAIEPIQLYRKVVRLPKGQTSCVVELDDESATGAANDDLGPNQALFLRLLEDAGPVGLEWSALTALLKAHWPEGKAWRSSEPARLRRELLGKGLIRIAGDQVFLADTEEEAAA